MNSHRNIAAAALAAVALVAVLYQGFVLSAARSENRSLKSQQEQAMRRAPGDAARAPTGAEMEELEKLKAETRDLHKVRNEIRQLRERTPDLDRLRADNLRLRSEAGAATGAVVQASASAPAPLVTRESLADAGSGTPEAALQSFFWAMRERNVARLRAALGGDQADGLRGQSDEEILAEAGKMNETFQGYQVIAKKVLSTDEVKLGVRVHLRGEGEPAPQEMALSIKRVGNDWKLDLGQH